MLVDLAKEARAKAERPATGQGLSMPSPRARALLIVLDSVGIGGAEDAEAYGDGGADTRRPYRGSLRGRERRPGGASRGARSVCRILPSLGLGLACEASTGRLPPNLAPRGKPRGAYGYGVETSRGKDTPSGHWEIAGVPVDFDWGYFPAVEPCFPSSSDRGPDPRGRIARHSRQPARLGHRDRRGARRGERRGAASRSATPRSTASFRSRPMRAPSASSGSMGSAGSRDGFAILIGSDA